MAAWSTPGIFGPLQGVNNALGGMFSQPPNNMADPRKEAMMAMAAQLLAGSGPSPQKRVFGELFGQALLAGQSASKQAQQMNAQQAEAEQIAKLRQAQIDAANKPDTDLVVVVGSDGKPRYVKKEDAVGMAPFVETGSAQSLPADVLKTQWYLNASPEERAAFDRLNQREQAVYLQSVSRVLPDGSTQMGVFDARARDPSNAYQWTQPVVPAGTKARVDAVGSAVGEAQGAQAGKAPAKASMDYVLSEFEKQIPETMQGGVGGAVGKSGKVFDYKDAARFDNLREQLSTEIRTVFRIPGEGTLSDREQAQYGIQLPSRDNPPEVNKKILDDLRERTRLRTETAIGPDQSGTRGTIRRFNPSTGMIE